MEIDEPMYQGPLLFPPSGKLLKKSWTKKYCILFKSSKVGIARIEIYENELKVGPVKIITLENVIKITPKPPTYFSILTRAAEYEFITLSEDSLNDWFRAVQSVAFPDELPQLNSIQEDNDLYCSSDEGVFFVKLHPSDASNRCQLTSKNYTLVLTSSALQLRNEGDEKLLYTWPYCYIRRYGYKNGMFTFEAGRKCASGEGIFYLEHPQQHEIYRVLASKMKSMKKMLSDSTSSLLDCGDLQLHAALSMEARSRSPLPPSPNTLPSRSRINSLQETNLSFDKVKTFHSSVDYEDILSDIPKPLPIKPPRKSVPNVDKTLSSAPKPNISINQNRDYQDISINDKVGKYDVVESRIEAWKTMGVDEPSHTEKITSAQESQDFISWRQERLEKSDSSLRKAVSEIKLTDKGLAPAVITEPSITLDGLYYDRLNFFGSSGRLNVSSGYKQVIPAPLVPVTIESTPNYYDEVQCIEPARSADDSHLGYARIRKDVNSGTLKEISDDSKAKLNTFNEVNKDLNEVRHQFQNEEPYAVISKPKRV